MKEIFVPISPGELIDKITILRIKAKQISDSEKVMHVLRELWMLEEIWKGAIGDGQAVSTEERELEAVNKSLWETVEDIHRCEKEKKFDGHFMELARRVCADNDKRAEIKKKINIALGSILVEEKSHQ